MTKAATPTEQNLYMYIVSYMIQLQDVCLGLLQRLTNDILSNYLSPFIEYEHNKEETIR